MPKSFTHYWRKSIWDKNRFCTSIVSNSFEDKGVESGDTIYVVTVSLGMMFVCGKMTVHNVCDAEEAAHYLKCKIADLWETKNHAVSERATPMRFGKIVPHKVVKKLRFVGAKQEIISVKFAAPDEIDRQSLRNVRQLNSESARELDPVCDSSLSLERAREGV